MTAASMGVMLLIALFVERTTALAVAAGMIGPLVVAVGSWLLVEQTFTRSPERLTATMIAAFGVKVVFFGVYVAVLLMVASLPPLPFVFSFTGYFIALHLTE